VLAHAHAIATGFDDGDLECIVVRNPSIDSRAIADASSVPR